MYFFDNQRSTYWASKIKLKTDDVKWINSNIQLCCDATSVSLLLCMCVAGLTSFDFIVVTTLFETLTKMLCWIYFIQNCMLFKFFQDRCINFKVISVFHIFKTKWHFWFWCCGTLHGTHHLTRWATIRNQNLSQQM